MKYFYRPKIIFFIERKYENEKTINHFNYRNDMRRIYAHMRLIRLQRKNRRKLRLKIIFKCFKFEQIRKIIR